MEKSVKIVQGTDLEKFQEEINNLLSLGYQLHGNLVVNNVMGESRGMSVMRTYYYQVLVKANQD